MRSGVSEWQGDDTLDCLIIGGGPAGLTAACDARDAGWEVTVLEKDPH